MPNLTRSFSLRAALLSGAVALMAACSDAPTAPAAATSAPRAVNAAVADPSAITASSSASLLACENNRTRSASAVIGPNGGIVGVAGSALVVPPGAVATPTTFTFTLPASHYLTVDVSAAGVEHYSFARPVAISVSYAHCSSRGLPDAPLGAWWVDPSTLQQLGVVAAVDDRRHRRLTFVTDHLSGYAVVY
jgi:hypothetical protein